MSQLPLQQAFDLAVQRHQSGRLPQAEQLYRQAPQPNHADALHLQGRLAAQLGKMDAPRFARNIEAACRRIWQKWCATPSDAR